MINFVYKIDKYLKHRVGAWDKFSAFINPIREIQDKIEDNVEMSVQEVAGHPVSTDQVIRLTIGEDVYEINVKKVTP